MIEAAVCFIYLAHGSKTVLISARSSVIVMDPGEMSGIFVRGAADDLHTHPAKEGDLDVEPFTADIVFIQLPRRRSRFPHTVIVQLVADIRYLLP